MKIFWSNDAGETVNDTDKTNKHHMISLNKNKQTFNQKSFENKLYISKEVAESFIQFAHCQKSQTNCL